ncbi:hypothetical protein [Streptomyces thinghirensis]|uniref:hypothetical protein n=1 Tax=Streptomyces thinghirensis TaxID=551547 RepID=UPI0031EDEB64
MVSPPGAVVVGGCWCGRGVRWTGAAVAGVPVGAVGVEAGPAPDGRAGAAPGSPRSPSGDEGAAPEESGRAFVVRRLAGRARRCTAAGPDGALVRDCRGRGAADGTGDTRTPRAAWAGALAGAADDAGPVARARWTGAAGAAGAVPGTVEGEAVGPGADGAVAAGIARSGATGIRCTGAAPADGADGSARTGRPGPASGCADSPNAPDSMPLPAAGFSTAGDGAPVNDGFCHVGSRPPNPASATPVRASPVARWIGGRPVQAATATGAGAGAGAGVGVRDVLAVLPPVSGPPAASAGGVSAPPAMSPPTLPPAPSRAP